MLKKLVYGVALNDADYTVQKKEYIEDWYPSGKRKQKLLWICPYYGRWRNMIERCYHEKTLLKYPTYKDCTVCEEWLLFSNFKSWMETQDWEGKELDKDLLTGHTKIYSPETCVFVDQLVNKFLLGSIKSRGKYLIGCCWSKTNNKFIAVCRNPFYINEKMYIGYYTTEKEAHLAWKRKKHEYACELANSKYVDDKRIAEALRNKYKNYNMIEDHII